MKFYKYSANGNDFVVFDHPSRTFTASEIQRICDRHFGVGADGVLILEASQKASGRMRIFNADGGEAEMCANGLRCLFTHLRQHHSSQQLTLETMNGLYEAFDREGSLAVEMSEIRDQGRYQLSTPDFEASYYVNTGVPHFLLLGKDIRGLNLDGVVKPYRHHPDFPGGANIDLVEILSTDKQEVWVRTFERGVEGETLSCGTGITATALALREWLGWKGVITMHTRGGRQQVELGERILYSGEVICCFSGDLPE